ncbi:hypothetical protein H2198_002510 [Neophaeococcomyces mojaviensis]|uniref:Uncharacterized protein n=1 Tax=Neophaeococcomyces mojaviensis TaxID=3383035 RepID=A0ACC3AE86_9EURO|nr:hypothetical protein H2198_002510 [Knufia sp. JES_112]
MESWAVVEHAKPLQKITKPRPEPTGTQVLLEVTHCGVCHSDLHFWEGSYDLGGGKVFKISERGVKLPRAIGHEIAGRVVKLGPDATSIEIGSSRIVYPWVGCGTCRRCQQGDDNLCAKQRSLGVLEDGGFASHVVVPHPKYLVDPGSLDLAVACTFGCSGITVFSAISKILPLEPDDWVVLIGAGGVGLSAIAMLQALGHKKILSVDISPEKRDAALAAGATTYLCGSGPSLTQEILSVTNEPVLGIIDFVNNSQTAATALAVLNKGGKMVQVGVMGGELNLSLVGMIFKAATIMGNNTGNLSHLHKVVELAKLGKLLPVPVSQVPWNNANDALMQLHEGKVTGRLVLVRDVS